MEHIHLRETKRKLHPFTLELPSYILKGAEQKKRGNLLCKASHVVLRPEQNERLSRIEKFFCFAVGSVKENFCFVQNISDK